MKRVTFVCNCLERGGAERVTSVLIRYLAGNGWDVQLILLYSDSIKYPIPDNVRIVCLNWNKHRSVVQAVKRYRELRKSIESEVVISFLYSATRDTVLSLVGTNKRVIISERNDPRREPAGRSRQLIRDIVYLFAQTIVFQTDEAKDYFPKAIRKKGVIIPNPVDNDLPKPFAGEREKVIIAAGRLEAQKNFGLLIRAFSILSAEHPDYFLRICGTGPQETELKRIAKSLHVEDRVEFLGFVTDVRERMNTAAMYVSSSDYEGISNSMIEAVAMGVPAICTDCPVGGARQTIEDGVSGLLVPVGDVEALHHAMKRMIEDPGLASRLSKNAVGIRDKLGIDNIANQWIRLMLSQ